MLWANGAITIETVKTGKSGTVIKSSLNKMSGKMSMLMLSFNEANWGSATCAYVKAAHDLKPKCFLKIMETAISFLEMDNTMCQQDVSANVDSNDICVNLVKMCDDDNKSNWGSSAE